MDDSAFSFDNFEELPDLETRLQQRQAGGGSGAASVTGLRKQKEPLNLKAAKRKTSKAPQVEAVIISSDEEWDKNFGSEKENEDEITFIAEVSKSSQNFSPVRKGSNVLSNSQENDNMVDGARRHLNTDMISSDEEPTLPSNNCRLAPIFEKQKQVLPTSEGIEPVSPPRPPLTKAEAKKRAVEERKIERERLKKQKLEEKERSKQQKLLEKVAKKADSLSECTKWLQVRAGEDLLSRTCLSELPAAVGAAGLVWDPHLHPPLDEAITFCRLCPLTRQETKEGHAIVMPRVEDFVELVRRQVYATDDDRGMTLEQQCEVWREALGVQHLTIFLWQLDAALKNLKKNRRRNEAFPNRLDCETALALVQLKQRVNHRIFSAASDVAEYTVCIARAVAQAPYKRRTLEDQAAFAWYAESANVCPVRVAATGVGLLKLWLQQLRQFTSVGLETAQAVATLYPAPALLLQAYEGLSKEEGQLLLADIPVVRGHGPLQTTRRVGKELSSKVYTFFTSTDPHRILGS